MIAEVDLAAAYGDAMHRLDSVRKRLASVFKQMFGSGLTHCEIQGRELIIHLKDDSISEDFPRKLFSIGFESIVIRKSNGVENTERTDVDSMDSEIEKSVVNYVDHKDSIHG